MFLLPFLKFPVLLLSEGILDIVKLEPISARLLLAILDPQLFGAAWRQL
jgi:hypothetical protein